MNTRTNFFVSLLLIVTITMIPGIGRSQDLLITFYDEAYHLIVQIQDLELMERNIEKLYEAEKRKAMFSYVSQQTLADSLQINCDLLNRVFAYLAGSLEYERFFMAYRELVRSPRYKQLHSANLFYEYMRLIESGRTRLTTQLQERLRSLAMESSTKSGFLESDSMNLIVRQYSVGAETPQIDGGSPTIIQEAQTLLTGQVRKPYTTPSPDNFGQK